EDRWPWLRAIAAYIAEHRAAGTRCVVTCSALKRVYRDIVTDQQSADVRLVYLKGTQALVASRLQERKGHFMPPGLLASQFATLEPPGPDERPVMVSINASAEAVVDDILRQLGLNRTESSTPRTSRT
ncbi:MAG: hypothetical protein JO283_13550, partial [Bradyrhizobium sp.]|nr:hypothetical protein [Bradyrhizobium sp.]